MRKTIYIAYEARRILGIYASQEDAVERCRAVCRTVEHWDEHETGFVCNYCRYAVQKWDVGNDTESIRIDFTREELMAVAA